MKTLTKLLALIALLPALAVAAGQSPYGVFGGADVFANLPGNIPLTFTAAPTGTSATLAANWPSTTGSYLVVFSDFQSRTLTLTNAATTATWSTALVGTPTKNATVDGFTATPGNPTYAYTSDLGVVMSNGTAWYATDNTIAVLNISSGCATISASKGNALAAQFVTSGTSCTPVIQLPPAQNGWNCFAQDVTHPVVFTETAQTTFSCTVTGTTTAADVVQFFAQPY